MRRVKLFSRSGSVVATTVTTKTVTDSPFGEEEKEREYVVVTVAGDHEEIVSASAPGNGIKSRYLVG